ncbi:uncharacterized protein JCM6883_005507 [Sporobolomyces salmoneus]|uniref:uncharacterized protein n=1 Tax=Sporobolomyces salmoneus TaxID=183962 RepID=UPI00316C24DE
MSNATPGGRGGGGGGNSAWVVNWRNPQARKNKTWENDGYLHVQGPNLTFYGEEGNKIGQMNFMRPLAEEMEIKIAGKEIRIDYSITTSEFWSKIRGEGSSRGTPAPIPAVRPGFFARPPTSASASHSTPQQAQGTRPPQYRPSYTPQSGPSRSGSVKPVYQDSVARAPRPKNNDYDDVFRADTPEQPELDDSGFSQEQGVAPMSATKTWIDPKKQFQKPFKFPTPLRKTSPGLEYGVAPPSVGAKKVKPKTGRSKMYEEVLPKEEEDEDQDEDEEAAARDSHRRSEKSSRADAMAKLAMERERKAKGKGVRREEEEQEEEEGENASTQAEERGQEEEDGPTPPKKRKLDPPISDSSVVAAARKPRVSAADLALSRSISSSSKPAPSSSKSTSKVKDNSTKSSRAQLAPIQPKPKREPLDSDSDPALFLDASSYQDDEFGLGGGGEGDAMDWDAADGLNEDGLFDALSSEKDGETEKTSKKRTVEAVESKGEGGGGTKTRYFTCQWRKQSTKKNPTWEGDGIIRVDKTGRATVRDTETYKEIAATTLSKSIALEEDKVLRMGNKEIEIGTPSDRQAYDGASHEKPVASSSSSRLNPPSSSRDIRPVVPRSSSASTFKVATPSLSRGFAIPGTVSKPGSVSGSGIKPGNFFGKSSSGNSQNTPKGPKPLFDPTVEGAIVMKRPDEKHQAEYNPKGHPIVDVVIDPKIGNVLRPHQQEGVRFMYECAIGMSTEGQGCILADEMGLGKTIQSIALIWTLLKQNPYFQGGWNRAGVIERAMIVCPVTLMKNWASEIKKWLGKDVVRVMVADGPTSVKTFVNSRNYQVLIVGYDRLTNAIEDVKYAQPPIGLIICDEGHKLKSSGTKTAKALSSLSCQRRVILSGTPIQNNLGEFFAMMDFVNPGLLQDYSYFKKHFEQPILKARKSSASKKDKQNGKIASESLGEIQRKFFLRRTADILEKLLPPKLEYTVFIVPTRREVEIYQQLLASSAVRSLLSGKAKSQQLSLLILLRKCATTPGLLMQSAKSDQEKKGEDSVFESELTDLFPTDIVPHDFSLSGKLIALAAMLKKLHAETEEKIVVVSNFTQTLDIVEKHCKKQKYPFCRLDGKTAQADRIPMVNIFNRSDRKRQFIFLLSSKSGGTGLNIIGASRLVLLDSEWNPSTDLQAMARIHRDGQTRTCVIYRFLTSGTIDEKIFQRQITKMALSGSVMEEDSTSTSTKGDAFTADDLKKIFTLHTDTACDTHDLLGCNCHRGEDPAAFASQEQGDDDDDDSDDEEDTAVFVPASQMGGVPVDKRALKKAQRNLSILKQWHHFDCSDYPHLKVSIKDQFLVSLIWQLFSDVDMSERVVKPVCEMTEEERSQAEEGKRTEVRGGQIGWVFEKKVEEKKRRESEEPGSGSGEGEGEEEEGAEEEEEDD